MINNNYLIILLLLMGQKILPILPLPLIQKCPQWTLTDLVRISPIIVDGTVISHGQNRQDGQFEVTFKVNTVYKGDLKRHSYVRLTLASSKNSSSIKVESTNNVKVECPKTLTGFHHRKKQRKFLIFAKDSRLFGLEALVSPLKRNRRAKLALKKALCLYKPHYYCHTTAGK